MFEPYFLIREKYQDITSQEIKISNQVIERMINVAEFNLDHVRIPISGKHAVTTIALCLTSATSDAFQISGFPRDLLVEDALIGTFASIRVLFDLPLYLIHAHPSSPQPQPQFPRCSPKSAYLHDGGVRVRNVGKSAISPQPSSGT